MKKLIAITLAALALSACSSAEKQAQIDHDFTRSEAALDAAQRSASFTCHDAAQCDQAWALTKDYITQHSEASIIRADAAAIESDVPSWSGRAVFSAARVAKPDGAVITLYAQCRGMYGPERAMGSDYDECVGKIVRTQKQYVPFLTGHLAAS